MDRPLDRVISALEARSCSPRQTGSSWQATCPSHDDSNPSLSVSEGADGRALVKCHAGCETVKIVESLGLQMSDLFPSKSRRSTPAPADANLPPVGGKTAERFDRPELTLEVLAQAKCLPVEQLQSFGCANHKYQGACAVRIEYRAEGGALIATRYRLGLDRGARFAWKKGSKVGLYGLDHLDDARAAGWVLIVEGESDCWTAWHHELPALGVPGKTMWRSEWAAVCEGLEVYVWQEPDAQDFAERIGRDLPNARIIVAPEGIKDLSFAHIAGRAVPSFVEDLKSSAPRFVDLAKVTCEAEMRRLESESQSVLEAEDPLVLASQAFRAMGYGGDLAVPTIVYVALTSRLLAMRLGSMPVHLLLMGQPSAGKSYAVRCALALLPEDAAVLIDAGSPRSLIYCDAELRHRVLVFGEADSLPSSEDNPAASAVRNLLQDHHLSYDVTVEDHTVGGFKVRHIRKPGPTVLITTAVHRLGEQLMSRLFVLDVRDTQEQVRAALAAQARIELKGATQPPPALVAFQELLQIQAPWDVYVPFAEELAEAIGDRPSASRVNRDFSRLLSLVKAVAVLRQSSRQRDGRGRLLAELADYDTVFELVGDMFEANVTGASERIVETIAAVKELLDEGGKSGGQSSISAIWDNPGESVSITRLADKLGLSKAAASVRVKHAIAGGWLVRTDEHHGRSARLELGDPLPERSGLPAPDELRGRFRGGIDAG